MLLDLSSLFLHLMEEVVLKFLDPTELFFVIDYVPHHCDQLSEVLNRLHFVEVKVSVLYFLVNSTRLQRK